MISPKTQHWFRNWYTQSNTLANMSIFIEVELSFLLYAPPRLEQVACQLASLSDPSGGGRARRRGERESRKKILPTWHHYETASSSMAWHMFKTKSDALSCGTFMDPAARSLGIPVHTFCEEGVLCVLSPSSAQVSGPTPPRPSVLGSRYPSETSSRAKFKWGPNQLTPYLWFTVVVRGIFNNTDRSPRGSCSSSLFCLRDSWPMVSPIRFLRHDSDSWPQRTHSMLFKWSHCRPSL